ncbi:MAG: hypothetical protein ACM3JJ_08495 [Hyphomicrobiales bacterium]
MTLPRPLAPEGSDPDPTHRGRRSSPRLHAAGAALAALLLVLPAIPRALAAPTSEDCLECHAEDDITMERNGKTVSLTVNPAVLHGSAHAKLACIECHAGFDPDEIPHKTPMTRVQCGTCHAAIAEQQAKSLHGQALAHGDKLAPSCEDCHGRHDVLPVKDFKSPVAPLNVPFLCGKCHQEGAPVQRQRPIHQDHILENFSESIHGDALLRKGLVVAPNCASCHTAHSILPHTDPASSIARRNIAATCTKCHAEIEVVHRKVIKGELWEKEAHVLPACVDCHQPHKIRKVFYDQGMADKDCMRCHADPGLKAGKDGRSLYVDAAKVAASIHAKTACSQCHSDVTASRLRPCETIKQKVDCSSCHAEIGQEYATSTHGQLFAKKDPNAPTCKECHGTHEIRAKVDPASATFPTNVPRLCAQCHREGQKAARRYKGTEHEIIEHYTESIHGKGLNQSGLTVTAMCTSCHTAHGELPQSDPNSSVNRNRIPATCGRCHHGIEEQFEKSIHYTMKGKTDKELPVCSDCHTAHTISRTDQTGFKLEIMQKCGRCHEQIAKTYFDTYHGKVSQLGYTKTAKCYDCHGAHDILPPSDPRSHLSHANVVKTCQKCHAGASRRFAGYLTHATHHDPKKYPFLFWTFWGMTSLLIATFTVGGIHTALWLPRAIAMRRERNTRAEGGGPEAPEREPEPGPAKPGGADGDAGLEAPRPKEADDGD